MDLYEHQGKDIFRAHGIATPEGVVATTPEEARAAAERFGGRAVVKVQVGSVIVALRSVQRLRCAR